MSNSKRRLLGWIAGDMFASDIALAGEADPALVAKITGR